MGSLDALTGEGAARWAYFQVATAQQVGLYQQADGLCISAVSRRRGERVDAGRVDDPVLGLTAAVAIEEAQHGLHRRGQAVERGVRQVDDDLGGQRAGDPLTTSQAPGRLDVVVELPWIAARGTGE